MSAKPKCPKCKRVLRDVPGGMKTEWQRAKGGTTVCCVCGCGWSKHVSRAAIIRLAVGKPETCKWEHSGEGDYISPHAAFMPWFPFCPHCGKPVEVVG